MRNLLAEAVAELHLEPGEFYRTTVNDIEVQFHRAAAKQVSSNRLGKQDGGRTTAPPDDEPSQFADMVMLEPWFESPPPQHMVTVKATIGPLPFPDPRIVPPDDEVAE